jgi:hypothetical protein
MDADIENWMKLLISYAEDWDATFRTERGIYFTQEYWYLFIECVRADADNKALPRKDALRMMRVSLGEDAKLERIQRAIDDKWLIGEQSTADKRVWLLRPTDKLRKAMNGHLARTLDEARRVVGIDLRR